MKLKQLIIGLLAMTAIFAGCEKVQPLERGKMTISISEMAFEQYPEGGQSVTITSNRQWKVKNYPEWLTVKQGEQDIRDVVMPTGESTVTVYAEGNVDEERIYNLVFNGGNIANKTLAISQKGKPVFYSTVAEVKAMLGTAESVTINDTVKIKATVVSNVELNNQVAKKNIIVQDSTGGIMMRLTENSSLAFGDLVSISLGGQKLIKYNGAFQIENIAGTNFTVKEAATTVEPIAADIKKFLANEYEGQYISIKDVQVAASDLSKTWGSSDAHTSINMVCKSGENFVVFSSKYSTYLSEKVPQGSGTICGVATLSGSTMQLMFGKSTDWTGLTGERFDTKSDTVTVAQALEKDANADVTIFGRVIRIIKDGFILNDGTQNSIYIYNGNKLEYTVAENDIVEVKGNISLYGATEIIPYKVQPSEKVISPTPELKINKLTPAQIAAYEGKAAVIVCVEGQFTYDASGPYYNLELEGQTIKGSLKPNNGVDISGFHGSKVVATGFYVGKSSKYFNISIASADDIYDDYMTLTPTSDKIKADSTFTKFNISTNRSWSITADEGYTVSPASGEGDAEITVSFAANTDQTKEKVGVVTVTPVGKIAPVKYTVTQEKAFDANRMTLTNEEIIAGIEKEFKKTGKGSASYKAITIQDAISEGDTLEWTGKSNWSYNSTTSTVPSPYIQIRNQDSAYFRSPVFSADIDSIYIVLDETKTSTTNAAIFYAIPVTTSAITKGSTKYSETTLKSECFGYGSNSNAGKVGYGAGVKFTKSTKQFNIVVANGTKSITAYIKQIEIYLKKNE